MAQKKLGSLKKTDTIISGSVDLAADVSSTVLPVANGGTGSGSFTNGQLLIGNTTGNTLTKASLTGTADQIVVTPGNGSITLSLPQSVATSSNVTFNTGNLTDLNVTHSATIQGITVGAGNGGVSGCVGVGIGALNSNSSGTRNVAIGNTSLEFLTTGIDNVAVGGGAGENLIGGGHNVLAGTDAAKLINAGTSATAIAESVIIGDAARVSGSSDVNTIVIGSDGRGEGSNTTVIGNTSTTGCHLYGSLKIGDGTDSTKTATIDCSGITTGTNRTLTLPNTSGTIVIGGGTCSGASSGTNTGDQTITLTGEATGSGTGSFAATLTNSAVIGKVLTGYTSGAGTVAATDTILQAIQKLNGNDATNANLTGPITSSGNATSIASQTGTGTKFVVDAGPTITNGIINQAANGDTAIKSVRATDTTPTGNFLDFQTAAAASVFKVDRFGALTANITAQASTAERLLTFGVSDSGSSFTLDNGTTNANFFNPTFNGTIEATVEGVPISFFGTKGVDTTTNPAILFLGRHNTGGGNTDLSATVALAEFRNRATSLIFVYGNGDLKLVKSGAVLGYGTGTGGTVTQATNRSTGVTLSKSAGAITTATTSLAAGASATFTVTNTVVAAIDVVAVAIKSGQTNKETSVAVSAVAAGTFDITVHNQHASTAETGAIVINFAIIKGATS